MKYFEIIIVIFILKLKFNNLGYCFNKFEDQSIRACEENVSNIHLYDSFKIDDSNNVNNSVYFYKSYA